jgi:GalNAc5-diNAcBac-PP-undecaprenol beta-1,3-glucosyltransferase
VITALVPTHSHGPLLAHAVRSALGQSVRELEVLIVGDGPTPATRECAQALAAADERVRYFEFEKGPRHGELHRHRVLGEHARGEVVLYLSDDDLWLEDHAAHMLELLAQADFAHALSCWFKADGGADATVIDLADPAHRAAVLAGDKTPSLSVGGHTMEAYRRLPEGWRTTPEGIHTDSWMWRQFLAEEWVRAVSGTRPTVVHLPSAGRPGWSEAQRIEELERYERAVAAPEWRRRHAEALLDALLGQVGWYEGETAALKRWGDGLDAQLREVWDDRARVYAILEGRESEG